ncbi:MAG: site-specific DNA-methyltransferase [Desulfobacterales bacterium]|nr:site-specific DNA-methyltransferase [Desulfobacterales bacterium]
MCIYIDPPYNTGNEKWAYNDNVNSPMMQEWLGKVVDREDLTRHDKWLCMMTPRLKLLRELLREDGVIFISIDDNEVHHLRMTMDEVFGEDNFVNLFTIKSNPRGSQASKHIALEHEYLITYAKSLSQTEIIGYSKSEDDLSEYKLIDEKEKKYRLLGLRQRGGAWRRVQRPNLYFPIYVNPKNGNVSLEKSNIFCKKVLPKRPSGEEGRWTWSEEKVKNNIHLLVGKKVSRIGESDFWDVFRKDHFESEDGMTTTKKPKSIWDEKELNYQNGRNELKEIFGNSEIFEYPKPTFLIKKGLRILDLDEEIILDSFAGSGTTAHAIISLNKEDGDNRKFILVECEDYADKITAERVRRVIKGVPNAKDESLRKGLGGSFSYFELGKAIELESILSGDGLPTYEELARYIFYTATGEEFDSKAMNEKKNFVGESRNYKVYLFYEPDIEKLKNTALTLERAKSIGKPGEKRRLIFAPTKYLDQAHLDELRIDFAQLPFEIYELAR